jgi:hypothetical protein
MLEHFMKNVRRSLQKNVGKSPQKNVDDKMLVPPHKVLKKCFKKYKREKCCPTF